MLDLWRTQYNEYPYEMQVVRHDCGKKNTGRWFYILLQYLPEQIQRDIFFFRRRNEKNSSEEGCGFMKFLIIVWPGCI